MHPWIGFSKTNRVISHLWILLVVAVALSARCFGAEPDGAVKDARKEAHRAVQPIAPQVPPEIVAALQAGKFDEAAVALEARRLASKNPTERAYFALLLGNAHRLEGRADLSRSVLEAALKEAPDGSWSAKIRSELAAVTLGAGASKEAEALSRLDATQLLATQRKDRLAQIYESYARKLLKPDDLITPPDPKAAYDLLAQARAIARGEALQARLLLDMAKADHAAKNFARAIQNFQLYVATYPKGDGRAEARFLLGQAQLAAGQILPARLTWTDLANDLADPKLEAIEKNRETRASALREIATTYQIPNPPDDASLNRGVAALRRFLKAYPASPNAVAAAFQVGQSYFSRGKSEDALAAFQAFLREEGFRPETDAARREMASLAMSATFHLGQILQGQKKFDEAIAAWRTYLSKFPNGPQGADAQRSIAETQILIGDDHLNHERHEEARAAWQSFVTQNPLDARVPAVLFRVGDSFQTQKKPDAAIKAWEPLISRFAGSEPAAHAQFETAVIAETEQGELDSAIEQFKKITVEPWRSRAAQRVAVMEGRALTAVTPRAFRSGEVPHLDIMTRNLEKLTFSAYKLNPEAYFRKKLRLNEVESLDIGLVAPDAEWTVDVPGYGKYKPIETAYKLDKLSIPGVYVVKVTDEKHLQATALVLGSDVDAIIKTSRDQVLLYVQDMKTGKGRPNARVLISDGQSVIMEEKTGADGVLLKPWAKPMDVNQGLSYLVIDEDHVAGSGLSLPGRVSQGLTARAYIHSDRPAYRPGQEVALRGVVRETQDGQYAVSPQSEYHLEVYDSRSRRILDTLVKLSDFGTFHQNVRLDSSAPVGSYRVRLFQPGKSEFSGSFVVQSYQLQKIFLDFDIKKSVVFRGETVEGNLVAGYQYGAPAANRPVALRLPDGRVVRGKTDASGKFPWEFSTDGFAEEQALQLVASLTEDAVTSMAQVSVAVRAFSASVATSRDVYLDGESFQANLRTLDALGKPTGEALSASLIKVVTQAGSTVEREVLREAVKTDPKTGEATVMLKSEDPEGGRYLVRVAGTDRFGNPVVADRALLISGSKDETRLRLLTDRQTYKVGENATVKLHSRGRAGTALVTWEADRILSYKLLQIQEGETPVAWAISHEQFPNFTLYACLMTGAKFDESRLDLRVERELKVALSPSKPSVGPGEEVTVDVSTVDQNGHPVAAEVAVALIDRSLVRQFTESTPPIGPFFYSQTRTGSFATNATNSFKYEAETSDVERALVEESERAAAVVANVADRGRISGLAKGQVMFAEPPAAPPMPAAALVESADAVMDLPAAVGGAGLGGMRGGRPMAKSKAEADPQAAGESFQLGLDVKMVPEEAAKEIRLRRQLNFSGTNRAMGRDGLFDSSDKSNENAPRKSAGPRERFVETAYWNPKVVTGADGKARITFRAPMALSEYEFSAKGVTGADTLVGQAASTLRVKQDFFVDLKAPSMLTEGDKPRFMAQVHHNGLKGNAEIHLTVYSGGQEQVFPRKLDIQQDGVDEILFDEITVSGDDSVRLSLRAALGDAEDNLTVEVPVRPWGLQAFGTASGTTASSTTVFVGLPPGRAYQNPEMLVVLSPTIRRMLIELAVGRDRFAPLSIQDSRADLCIFPPPPRTTIDSASDLLAAASVLNYLRQSRGASDAPETSRLTSHIQGLAAELVASQNDDGGWPWVSGGQRPDGKPALASDPLTSARAAWALSAAQPLGLLTDKSTLDKAAGYLTQAYARVAANDHETRAAVFHAMSTQGKANFETANSLNRLRTGLPDAALAYLALTFVNLNRSTLAGEILEILAPRGKAEAGAPGDAPRRSWGGSSETTALVGLAFARARPQAPEIASAVNWLLARRQGFGWAPHKAKGPALALLAAWHGKAQHAEDRLNVIVSVNDKEVYKSGAEGASEGQAILVPNDVLKPGGQNRVRLEIDGRGTVGYAVTLTGFTQDFAPDQTYEGRKFLVTRHLFTPAAPEYQGKALPVGFGVAVGATHFENLARKVELGDRVHVRIDAHRVYAPNEQPWERDFLVLEDHIPAGCALVEGSVQTAASHHEFADGVAKFYFAPGEGPGTTTYEISGNLPGQYRSLPPTMWSAYEVGRRHTAKEGIQDLQVLPHGQINDDPYKPTPDELYARGKALFDDGQLKLAAEPLEALSQGYALRDDVAKEAAKMLLLISIRDYDARKVVQYFEAVKEKAPEHVITFEDLLVIGRAYRDINEHERAMIVWRGVVDASYLEDARVGELLRQRGQTLDGIAYLLDLWREYPSSASIESDFFGLSQVLAQLSNRAFSDPNFRRELATADVTRSELILQSIRMTQSFLSQSPDNPLADEASLALVGNLLELEDYASVVKLASRYAKLFPKSQFLDSFQYSEALSEFHLGHHDRAVEVAEAIAHATYKDAAGVDQPSSNKWQAIYIIGQIFDARQQPAKALEYYKQVEDRFTDAADAVRSLSRKELKLAEVTVPRPRTVAKPVEGAPGVFRNVGVGRPADAPEPAFPDELKLRYRNIAEVDLKVYPVDLMRLYLSRRNLDQIADIDLAGITPLIEKTIKLGDGQDFAEKVRKIDLGLEKDGAYLAMIRGENIYTSGIILVSPVEIEVLEEPESGRVRVTTRNALTRAFLPKVQVKVIGSGNSDFISGETDLRGVFLAEGVRGQAAVVARMGTGAYAFHRGLVPLAASVSRPAPADKPGQEAGQADSLEKNIQMLNSSNQLKQIERLEQRYKAVEPGQRGAAAGGFR